LAAFQDACSSLCREASVFEWQPQHGLTGFFAGVWR
jgi:hypothetical protein